MRQLRKDENEVSREGNEANGKWCQGRMKLVRITTGRVAHLALMIPV